MKLATEGMTFDPMPMKRAFLVWGHGYKKLAALVGCSQRTAISVVNGATPCSKFLRPIAGVLNVNLRDCWKIEEARP